MRYFQVMSTIVAELAGNDMAAREALLAAAPAPKKCNAPAVENFACLGHAVARYEAQCGAFSDHSLQYAGVLQRACDAGYAAGQVSRRVQLVCEIQGRGRVTLVCGSQVNGRVTLVCDIRRWGDIVCDIRRWGDIVCDIRRSPPLSPPLAPRAARLPPLPRATISRRRRRRRRKRRRCLQPALHGRSGSVWEGRSVAGGGVALAEVSGCGRVGV